MLTDGTGHRVNDPSNTGHHEPPEAEGARLDGVLEEIGEEVQRAESLHAPLNSHHEAYAVILEELDEYWEQVRLKREDRDPAAMRKELIQTGAMCVRAILNVIE